MFFGLDTVIIERVFGSDQQQLSVPRQVLYGFFGNNQQMTQNPYRANYSNLNVNIFYATVLRRHWLDFNNFGCFEKVWTYILHFWYQCRHCNDYDYEYQ